MDLKVNPSRGKNLKFEFAVEGIDEELTARLILRRKDGSSLMFESKVKDNKVNLTIPPIKEYRDIEPSAILEVVSESKRFVPWDGDIEFEQEPSIKIESMEDKAEKKPSIKIESQEVYEDPEPLQPIVAKKPKLKDFLV
jgi:hypothetical protein